jgi:hypothetical protein
MIEKTIDEMNGGMEDNSGKDEKNRKKNMKSKFHTVCKVDLTEIEEEIKIYFLLNSLIL